jgi:hypothetical protein
LRWTWDPDKDAKNRVRHKLPLSVGEAALSDPLAVSKPDPHPDGGRWNTLADVDRRLSMWSIRGLTMMTT